MKMGQDGSVGIATRYGLSGPGMDSCKGTVALSGSCKICTQSLSRG